MGKKTDSTNTTETPVVPKTRKPRTPATLDPELKSQVEAAQRTIKTARALNKITAVLSNLDGPGLTQAALFLAGKLDQDGKEQVVKKLTAETVA